MVRDEEDAAAVEDLDGPAMHLESLAEQVGQALDGGGPDHVVEEQFGDGQAVNLVAGA
jgi:hypothetical protein